MKIKDFDIDAYAREQHKYKQTIEIISEFLQQEEIPIREINFIKFQQYVGSKVDQVNDVTKTQQNANITIISSKRERRRAKMNDEYIDTN